MKPSTGITVLLSLALGLAFVAFQVPWLGARQKPLDFQEWACAAAAVDAAKLGHWFPLAIDNQAWMEQPPLFCWIVAGCLKIFGNTSKVAQAVPLAFSGLCLFYLARLGVMLSGSLGLALVAVVLVALQPDFLYHALRVGPEPAFQACLLAAIWHLAFYFEMRRLKPRARFPTVVLPWIAGLWLALAAAFMSWRALAFFPALGLALGFAPGGFYRAKALALPLALPCGLVLTAWTLALWQFRGVPHMALPPLEPALVAQLALGMSVIIFPALYMAGTRPFAGSKPPGAYLAARMIFWMAALCLAAAGIPLDSGGFPWMQVNISTGLGWLVWMDRAQGKAQSLCLLLAGLAALAAALLEAPFWSLPVSGLVLALGLAAGPAREERWAFAGAAKAVGAFLLVGLSAWEVFKPWL